MIEFEQIKKAIDRRTIISFDLFDTLIKRDCYKPTELFYFIERKINQEYGVQSHFASIRIQAEINARKKSKAEEVSLDEIYDEISLSLSSVYKKQIKQQEEEYEYKVCQWNPLIKPVYEYSYKQRKRIFIITDIYLPETLIKRILRKLGIQYEALYVSSTFKKMKRNGTLFSEVLKQIGNHPADMLHIGDNKQSDYLMPKKLGIYAVHISKDQAVNLFLNRKLYKQNPQYANLCSFINNHADTHSWNAANVEKALDFFSEAGYETQGPILYGYVTWLHEQFKMDGIEKAFFLARDGQLMQKAYRKLDHLLPNEYMYASRKALIIPSLWMTPSIQEIKKSIYWGKRGTISSFLKKIGLIPADFEQYYVDSGFSLNKVYEYENLWGNQIFLNIFEEHIKKTMVAHSREAYALLIQYLKQLDFSGKVAVVDIGWFGHMQGALEKIVKEAHIPVEIHGYYLGLRPESSILNYIQAKGYLFDQNHHQRLSGKEELFNAIVELLFMADHGTTKGYEKKDRKINPSLAKWEYSDSAHKEDFTSIQACQRGALAFIDDMIVAKKYFPFNPNPVLVFMNLLELGTHPSPRAAELFGDLHFMDDTVNYMANPQKSGYTYLLQPHVFLRELRNNFWRRGFIIRAFGNRFPFADGYDMARKLYCMLKNEMVRHI